MLGCKSAAKSYFKRFDFLREDLEFFFACMQVFVAKTLHPIIFHEWVFHQNFKVFQKKSTVKMYYKKKEYFYGETTNHWTTWQLSYLQKLL